MYSALCIAAGHETALRTAQRQRSGSDEPPCELDMLRSRMTPSGVQAHQHRPREHGHQGYFACRRGGLVLEEVLEEVRHKLGKCRICGKSPDHDLGEMRYTWSTWSTEGATYRDSNWPSCNGGRSLTPCGTPSGNSRGGSRRMHSRGGSGVPC